MKSRQLTESGWFADVDPQRLLLLLRDRISERKLRLFAIACCRRNWHLFPEALSRRAIEAAECHYGEGGTREEMVMAYFAAWRRERVARGRQGRAWVAIVIANPNATVEDIVEATLRARKTRPASVAAEERQAQAALLRDILGNPCRPASAVRSAWLTWNDSTIPKLARSIYRERAFDRLPILADALEEAGCEDAEVLAHCRLPGEHVPGCWVVDKLLGRG